MPRDLPSRREVTGPKRMVGINPETLEMFWISTKRPNFSLLAFLRIRKRRRLLKYLLQRLIL
jgi:hypothetical protein